jgi:hypothetical protein
MDDEFRARIADELAGSDEPPIGDVVAGSISKGRRMRTVRRLGFGGSAAAGVLAVSLGVAALAAPAGTPDRPASVLPAAASPTASTKPAATSPTASTMPAAAAKNDLVKATPAGLLELLLPLLPPGKTSHYAGDANELMVQTYLDGGAGPGMIRINVANTKGDTARSAPAGVKSASSDGSTYRVSRLPDNCIQNTIVFVQHPDGTLVQINLASCLAWDGKQNKPAKLALTVAQAVKIGADPRWGVQIDKSLVTAGAKQFPHLGAIE